MKVCPQCRNTFPTEFKLCPTDDAVLEVSGELGPGMTIRGKYLILDQIGEGGMGKVFSARHLAFNELRALKVISPLLAGDSSFLRRFKTEAIVARKLQHPNAVRIDDLDTTDDRLPFIVMELVEGESLKSRIMRPRSLSVEDSIHIAAQTADALGAAHDLGIVHRDIKPENILLARTQVGQDMVKVADLGIAKVFGHGLDLQTGYTVTRTGMIIGTPQYLSPEQAMGNEARGIDGRADIYSLGMVLFVMLTGRLPFESDTPVGFLVHHVHTVPPDPRDIRPDLHIPGELSAILRRMLEKDRKKRFATAHELAQALRSVGSGMSASPATPVGVGVTPSPVQSTAPLAGADHEVPSADPSSPAPVRPRQPVRNASIIVAAVAVLMVGSAIALRLMPGNWLSAQRNSGGGETPGVIANPTLTPQANAPVAAAPAQTTTSAPAQTVAQRATVSPSVSPPLAPTHPKSSANVNPGEQPKRVASTDHARIDNPKRVAAALALSEFYADRGECDRAIATLQDSLKQYPGNQQLARRLAALQEPANKACSATQ
jgi:serine/threonine protein kinase